MQNASVWIIQPSIEHYRVPVFDALRALGHGRYALTVLGPLKDGAATGGVRRPFFEALPYERRRVQGQEVTWWPGVEARVRRRRPEVVIVGASVRCLSAWRLPAVCRSVGATPVAWTKAHSFSGLPTWLTDGAKSNLLRRYERAVVYGELSRQELEGLGVPDHRIHVARNTIDTRRIFTDGEAIRAQGAALRAAHGLTDRPVIVYMGRLAADKRVGDLFDAWPALKAKWPELALVIAGGGPELDAVRGRAQQMDPEGADLQVLGRVPEGDDYAWIATADATVQPGAVGLAINQSMALGVPTVIADEIGADTEILVHGETGWRYPRGDVQALTHTLNSVLSDQQAVGRITEAARHTLRDEVTLEAMAQVIDGAIRAALALRGD